MKKQLRQVEKGDVVKSKLFDTDIAVSRISMVLHLDNGADEVYDLEDEIEVYGKKEVHLPPVEHDGKSVSVTGLV